MRGEGVDEAMIGLMQSGDPMNRLEIIKATGHRQGHAPFAALHRLAETDEDGSLRRDAIMSMGRIGLPTDLPILVQLAVAPKSADDRSAIERAVLLVLDRIDNRDTQARPFLTALAIAPDDAKPILLGLLRRPATQEAFEEVSAAVTSTNSTVSDAAIRALGEWPNPAPVAQLYEIASTSGNQTHRDLSLSGDIRLAPLTPDPTSSYVSALRLSKSDDEKRRILGGLQHAGTRKALEIAESHMNHPNLKADAYQAAVKVLRIYCWQDRSRAKEVLDKIIANAPDDGIRDQAKDVIRKMDEYEAVLTAWKGTQAFTIPGVADGNRVFETVFEPEQDFDSKDIVWRIVLPEFEGGGKIDLEKTYGGIDYCCAYLRTTIHSPVEQEAQLNWRADDAIKGWLNGQATGAGSITLKAGANPFIIKVGDHGGGWSFECQIVKPDGSPLEGLRYEL